MQLLFTSNSTNLSYWLNWRVLLCAIWVLTPMLVAIYIIWKYECLDDSRSFRAKTQQEIAHSSYGNAAWRPCLKLIHPIWLLLYRVIAVCLLLATLIVKVSLSGLGMFYYYTQWTFTLVTIYFGLGVLLSIYGCYQCHKMDRGSIVHHVGRDAEQGCYVPLLYEERTDVSVTRNISNSLEDIHVSKAVSVVASLFQVIYQINAGAVMFTDLVYWAVIFPFLTIKDYDMNFMTLNLHSLNAILLLGDTALNCLPFPWFRISYFILWTGVFVISQWIFHACSTTWWPYPFFDLSSSYAPLWYLLMALLNIPCYAIFVLIIKMKHYLLSKWFPQSCQCSK